MNIHRLLFVFAVLALASCHKNNGGGATNTNNNNSNTDSLLKYTIKMQGDHTWKGWWDPPTGHLDSFTFEQPISYVNDTTVIFWTRSLGFARHHFLSASEADKTITFSASTEYVGGFNDDTLVYDYQRNIIYFNSYSDYRAHVAVYHLHTP